MGLVRRLAFALLLSGALVIYERIAKAEAAVEQWQDKVQRREAALEATTSRARWMIALLVLLVLLIVSMIICTCYYRARYQAEKLWLEVQEWHLQGLEAQQQRLEAHARRYLGPHTESAMWQYFDGRTWRQFTQRPAIDALEALYATGTPASYRTEIAGATHEYRATRAISSTGDVTYEQANVNYSTKRALRRQTRSQTSPARAPAGRSSSGRAAALSRICAQAMSSSPMNGCACTSSR